MPTRISLLFFALLVGALPSSTASAAEIVRVRHSSTAERTRVVLDLSRPAHYSIRRVHDPERVVLEFPRSVIRSLAPISLRKGRVGRVRFNDLGNRLQVVLDLRGTFPFHDFSLPAVAPRPARVVVDVLESGVEPVARSGKSESRSSRPVTASHDGRSSPARYPAAIHAPGEGRPYVIIIDPGHGGRDPGTRGCGVIREKDLVLRVAKRMAAELRALTNFKVILTRRDDRFVSLRERVRIARRNHGDLFLSIHANSARSSKAHGAEVYFLSPRGATDQASAELADRENAAHMVGMDAAMEVDDTMMSILMDLQSSGILRRSGQFAELTLQELGGISRMDSRFIKQARFAVLRTLSMPSILVEVGYLSNRREAKYLKHSSTQGEIARAMANAVMSYCERYGEKGQPQIARHRMHKVRRGDTLWDLARLYDTSVLAIARANHLETNSLRVGQNLILP